MSRHKDPPIKLHLELKDCGYMLIRSEGKDAHAHFSDHKGAAQVKWCIEHGLLPLGEYFRESCRRLLTDEEYAGLSPKKQKPHTIRRYG